MGAGAGGVRWRTAWWGVACCVMDGFGEVRVFRRRTTSVDADRVGRALIMHGDAEADTMVNLPRPVLGPDSLSSYQKRP